MRTGREPALPAESVGEGCAAPGSTATVAAWVPVRVVALVSWNGNHPYRELAEAYPNLIEVHELLPDARKALPRLVLAPAGALIIDGHGDPAERFEIGCHRYHGLEDLCPDPGPQPSASAIILCACYPLARRRNGAGGMTRRERGHLLGRAQFAIGGRGEVGRRHGPAYARAVVEALAAQQPGPGTTPSAAQVVAAAQAAHRQMRARFPKWRKTVRRYHPR